MHVHNLHRGVGAAASDARLEWRAANRNAHSSRRVARVHMECVARSARRAGAQWRIAELRCALAASADVKRSERRRTARLRSQRIVAHQRYCAATAASANRRRRGGRLGFCSCLRSSHRRSASSRIACRRTAFGLTHDEPRAAQQQLHTEAASARRRPSRHSAQARLCAPLLARGRCRGRKRKRACAVQCPFFTQSPVRRGVFREPCRKCIAAAVRGAR